VAAFQADSGCVFNMSRQITAIEPQQKNPKRVNVYLDGEFAFGLALITAAWLQVGQNLSEEKIAALQQEDGLEMAYQKALHFLSYRPRSSAEVRQNLKKRGLEEELIETTLRRLQEAGLVDDRQFARAWVENRNEFRPRSRSALRMELRRKGLDEETIQATLEETVDEQALAYQAARQQARRYTGLEWPQFRLKLGGFLARRGFSYTIMTPIVSEVWKEFQAADGGPNPENEE
jgi:regulatory protein